MPAPTVTVLPEGLRPHIRDAVQRGGGRLVDPEHAQVLVWTDPADPTGVADVLASNPHIEIVQLLWAGVEAFAAAGLFDDGRTWLCGKGVYAGPVAEHALTLALAGMRGLPGRVSATSWGPQWGTSLIGGQVTILGGGGIAQSLLGLLAPFDVTTTVVRNTVQAMADADHVRPPEDTVAALSDADLVVLALPLLPSTRGVIDAAALDAMRDHAWLVNVARGEHVVTDDLVAALGEGRIAGAGLDVTDPEPLPDGHPLWAMDDVIITPHTANTEAMAVPLVSARVSANIRRLIHAEPLIGEVDPKLGY